MMMTVMVTQIKPQAQIACQQIRRLQVVQARSADLVQEANGPQINGQAGYDGDEISDDEDIVVIEISDDEE